MVAAFLGILVLARSVLLLVLAVFSFKSENLSFFLRNTRTLLTATLIIGKFCSSGRVFLIQ